jgi:LysM repeat protein
MIAMSDAVILLVSASILGSGIYRWQANMDHTALVTANNASQSSTTVQATAPTATQVTQDQVVVNQSGDVRLDNTVVMNTQGGLVMGKPANSTTPINPQNPGVDENQGDAVAVSSSASSSVDEPLYGLHVVVSGDTLSVLSQRFGTTVANLQSINGISGSLINVGQELRYPLPAN